MHHGRYHSCDFECGLCDYKAKSIKKLNTHLSNCEIYECDDCYFRVTKLSEIKAHLEELHENENTKIIHAKLDRKDENFIIVTEHLRNELFGTGNENVQQRLMTTLLVYRTIFILGIFLKNSKQNQLI